MIEPAYQIDINVSAKRIVRNTALVTATIIVTKGVMDVAGCLVKPHITSFTRKARERAVDKAHWAEEEKQHAALFEDETQWRDEEEVSDKVDEKIDEKFSHKDNR